MSMAKWGILLLGSWASGVWSVAEPEAQQYRFIGGFNKHGHDSSMLDHDAFKDAPWTPRTFDRNAHNWTLRPLVYESLPVGSILPASGSWVEEQIASMTAGLPGHMSEFYHWVKDSRWLGGEQDYSDLNEAWPYWYNGMVSLAFAQRDDKLKKEVLKATEYIVERQFDDGWFGPEREHNRRNFWGRYPFMLGLMQLIETKNSTITDRIFPALQKYIDLMYHMLLNDYEGYVWKEGDDFDEQWGRSRAADMIMFLQWLYNVNDFWHYPIVYEDMVMLYEKSYDWTEWFAKEIKGDIERLPDESLFLLFPFIHNVNVAQALKYNAVVRRLTHDDSLLEATKRAVRWVYEEHGSPSGAIIGDERLSNLSPVRGAELCGVAESIYSLSYLFQATGDPEYVERAELAAFNALPVMATADHWAHQYVAQTNQPVSWPLKQAPFWNVNSYGQTFGTEPHYPCCTVNYAQGFPKLLAASWVKHEQDTFVHSILMPSEVNTTLSDGSTIFILCNTNYPFDHHFHYHVDARSASVPVKLKIRMPMWITSAVAHVRRDSSTATVQTIDSSAEWMPYLSIDLDAGSSWLVVVDLKTDVRVVARPNDGVAVYYGALLYALPVPSTNTSTQHPDSPVEARDYVMSPRSSAKWNVAIDPSTVELSSAPEAADYAEDMMHHDCASSHAVPSLPKPVWSESTSPYRVRARACQVQGWALTESEEGGYAPLAPALAERRCVGPSFEVELQPYGGLKLHMGELPVMDLREYQAGESAPGESEDEGADADYETELKLKLKP